MSNQTVATPRRLNLRHRFLHHMNYTATFNYDNLKHLAEIVKNIIY